MDVRLRLPAVRKGRFAWTWTEAYLMAAPEKQSPLPANLPPIGLSRIEAAAYIGLSATKFDELVKDGRMPRPKRVDARRIWMRPALEKAFADLPDHGVDAEEGSDRGADDAWSLARL